MADDSIINYSDLIGKDATFDDLSNEIDNLKAELLDLAKVYQKALSGLKPSDTNGIEDMDNKIKELIVTQKNLLKVEKMGRDAKKKNIELTQEQLIQAQSEKIAQRERVKEAKQLAILRNAEKGSIEALRARLALVTVEWKKLTEEERKNGKTVKINGKDVKNLVKEKRKLTDELKRLEKQTGDTRRNVGNYSDSLSKLGKVATRVFIGRTAVDFFRKIATGTQELIEANKEADSTIGALDTAFGRFAKSGGSAALNVLKFFAPLLTTAANGVADFLEFIGLASSDTDKFIATSTELAGVTDKLSQEFTKEAAAADQVFTALESANEGSQERKDLIDQVNKQYGKYLPNLLDEKSTLEDIASAQDLVNEALTKGFLIRIQQATQTDIFTNKVKLQRDRFENLRKTIGNTDKDFGKYLGTFSKLAENFDETQGIGKDFVSVIKSVAFSGAEANKRLQQSNPLIAEFASKLKQAGKEDLVIDLLKAASIETEKYNNAIGDTQASLKGLEDGLGTFDHGLETNNKKLKKNAEATTSNADARLAAIEKLRDAAANAEAESIEDATERALALEKLRFDRLEKLRLEQLEKDIKLFKGNDEKIKEIQALNYTIAEKNLTDHEEKKLEIRKKFALETANLEVITEEKLNQQREKAIDDELKQIGSSSAILKKQQEEIAAENNKAIEEAQEQAAKKTEQRQKELFDSIGAAAKKLSAIVSDLFKKQVDQASANVEEQTKNLERAEERAQQGLESNIAFERKELAARQSERLQREKEAANAAKLTTLFNLVSAYAQGGDENALFRGLADFALLEAFGAGIQGFFDGTENVERDLGGASKFFQGQRDAYLGVTNSGKLLRFDGKERIFNPAQNALLGGMSNEEAVNNALVGSWVSDNFQASSIMGNSIFGTQKANFETAMKPQKQQQDSRLIQEVRALRQAVSSKPSSDVDMVKVYKNITDLVKREVKSAMTRTSKKRLS